MSSCLLQESEKSLSRLVDNSHAHLSEFSDYLNGFISTIVFSDLDYP
jgi:hypothetical protein